MKKTMYEPIAVNSGELPPLNIDFIGIDINGELDNYFFSSYDNFDKHSIKTWLKETIIDVADDKEPVYPNESVVGVKFEDRIHIPWEDNMK